MNIRTIAGPGRTLSQGPGLEIAQDCFAMFVGRLRALAGEGQR